MHPFLRALTALFALWFAVVIGDPGTLHACAMHGGAAHASATAGHDAHAAHHGGGQPATAPCSCVGHCCAATTPAGLASAPSVTTARIVAFMVELFAPASLAPLATAEHRLPFANGPPAI